MCWPFFTDTNYTNRHMPLMTMRSIEGPSRNMQYLPPSTTASPSYLPSAHSHSAVMTPTAFAASAGTNRPTATTPVQTDRPSWNKDPTKLSFTQVLADDV